MFHKEHLITLYIDVKCEVGVKIGESETIIFVNLMSLKTPTGIVFLKYKGSVSHAISGLKRRNGFKIPISRHLKVVIILFSLRKYLFD
jgi:hypothetical protein